MFFKKSKNLEIPPENVPAEVVKMFTDMVRSSSEQGSDVLIRDFEGKIRKIVEDSDLVATTIGSTRASVFKTFIDFILRKGRKSGVVADVGDESKSGTDDQSEEVLTKFVQKYKELEEKYTLLDKEHKDLFAKMQVLVEENKTLKVVIKNAGVRISGTGKAGIGSAKASSSDLLSDLFEGIDQNSVGALRQALTASKMDIDALKKRVADLSFELKSFENFGDEKRRLLSVVDGLERALAQKESEIKMVEARMRELQESLLAVRNASSGILHLRNNLLEMSKSFSLALEGAVSEVLAVGDGKILSVHFPFENIEESVNECMEIFSQLKPNILKDVFLFHDAVKVYEKLIEEFGKANGIPSVSLFKMTNEVLGKLKALKILQDQLIADSMDAQAGESAPSEEEMDVPDEFVKDGKLKNYYEVLECAVDSGEDDIKAAYKKMAFRYHPDLNKDPGAEDIFKDIQEAYDVLSDSAKKMVYDEFYKKFYS